jgi:hypothetical protein
MPAFDPFWFNALLHLFSLCSFVIIFTARSFTVNKMRARAPTYTADAASPGSTSAIQKHQTLEIHLVPHRGSLPLLIFNSLRHAMSMRGSDADALGARQRSPPDEPYSPSYTDTKTIGDG